MERYKSVYPNTDIVLFEPNRADADMFFTNLFSYSSRRRLCEHAYQKTREELWKRRHEARTRRSSATASRSAPTCCATSR